MEKCAGYTQIVMFLGDEIFTLGGAGFLTKEEQEKDWAEIQESKVNTDFVCDFLDENFLIEKDKNITKETVECLLDDTVENLLKKAKENLVGV